MALPKLCGLALLATTHALRSDANPRPMPRSQPTTLVKLLGGDGAARLAAFIKIRGGGLFDDPAEEPAEDDVDARMRQAMQKAVAMMRGVGSEGAAIDALEALASDPSAEAPQLIKIYLDARLHQSQELKSFQGDHYVVALRQLANEALAFKASTQLSEEAYTNYVKQLAEEAGAKNAKAFAKDVRNRSSLQVQELLEVLAEDGNFVAIALRRIERDVAGIEADLKEDLARGDETAAAQGRATLEKFRAWQQDSAPLEKLRQELLAQLENAEDPLQRVRLAESLRPVVTNVLGDDFSAVE